MIRSKVWFTLWIGMFALVVLPTRALAHGQPEITVTPDTVAAGSKITVTGDNLGANERFKILAEGLNFTAELGEVNTDADEKFEAEFTIPPIAPEGTYEVKAAGADGHTVVAELTVTAPASGDVMPSAAPHELPRSRTPLKVIGLFAAAVVSAGVGLTLVRWK